MDVNQLTISRMLFFACTLVQFQQEIEYEENNLKFIINYNINPGINSQQLEKRAKYVTGKSQS